MNYLVFDLETDGTTTYKRFCNPLDENHKVICVQTKRASERPLLRYKVDGIDRDKILEHTGKPIQDIDYLVGQNMKFDLLWSWPLIKFFVGVNQALPWDCMVVEYLLEGQRKQHYNLNVLSQKYGGTVKDDVVGTMLKSGKLFSEIPKDVAMKYAAYDVINTEKVFLAQYEKAKKYGMLHLINVWMQHLLAITEMEHNGLHFDMQNFNAEEVEALKVMEASKQKLEELVKPHWSTDKIAYDFKSPDHNSVLLFGGEIPYETMIDNPSKTGELFYKTGPKAGTLRTKVGSKKVSLFGLGIAAKDNYKAKKKGFYNCDFKVISDLLKNTELVPFQKDVLEALDTLRKDYKIVSTYYEGLRPCIMPSCTLHTEFKMHYTSTGRLSSQNPNTQNLHPGILRSIKPRNEGWKMVEIDFNALEVRVAAILSRDSMLIAEINNKIDLHRMNAANLYEISEEAVTKEQRKIAKALTFGLLYGQGSFAMSMIHHIDIELAKRFISNFYDKYVDIKEWHNKLIRTVQANKHNGLSRIKSDFGKIYTFTEVDSPEFMKKKGIMKSFKPTDIKNYTVQGSASVIVSVAAGLVYQECKKYPHEILMVNEVHDSLVFECKEPEVWIPKLTDIMTTDTMNYIEDKLRVVLPVPLEVEAKYGENWHECK